MPTKTKKTVKKAVKKTAKKTTKKVVKKTTKKTKTTSKKTPQFKALVCAEGEHCFWTTNGDVLKDLEQLQLAFGTMDDEVFMHHVTKEKNDFADWVESVLDDAQCAQELRKSRKPSTARTVVVRCLRRYSL